MAHIIPFTLEARVYEARPYDTFRSYAPQLPVYCQTTGEKDPAEVMDALMGVLPMLMSEPFMRLYAALLGKDISTDNSR